jgi:hypothetical protein
MRSILSLLAVVLFAANAFAADNKVIHDPQGAADAGEVFNQAKQYSQGRWQERDQQFLVAALDLINQKIGEGMAGLYGDKLVNVVITPNFPEAGTQGPITSSGYAVLEKHICQINVEMGYYILPIHASGSCATPDGGDQKEVEAGTSEFNIKLVESLLRKMRKAGQPEANDFDIRIKEIKTN